MGADAEILGVAGTGSGPLGPFEIRMPHGLVALYGRNGAGKSSVLERIASSVTASSLPPETYKLGACLRVHEAGVESYFDSALVSAIGRHVGAGYEDNLARDLWERVTEGDPLAPHDLAGAVAAMQCDGLDDAASIATLTRWAEPLEVWCSPGTTSGLTGFTLSLTVRGDLPEVLRAQELLADFWPYTGSPTDQFVAGALEGLGGDSPEDRLPYFQALVDHAHKRGHPELGDDDVLAALDDPDAASRIIRAAMVAPDFDYRTYRELCEPLVDELGERAALLLVANLGRWMQERQSLALDLPIPIVVLAELDHHTSDMVPRIELVGVDEEVDIEVHIKQLTWHGVRPLITDLHDDQITFDADALDLHASFVMSANELVHSLLDDAPDLTARIVEPRIV